MGDLCRRSPTPVTQRALADTGEVPRGAAISFGPRTFVLSTGETPGSGRHRHRRLRAQGCVRAPRAPRCVEVRRRSRVSREAQATGSKRLTYLATQARKRRMLPPSARHQISLGWPRLAATPRGRRPPQRLPLRSAILTTSPGLHPQVWIPQAWIPRAASLPAMQTQLAHSARRRPNTAVSTDPAGAATWAVTTAHPVGLGTRHHCGCSSSSVCSVNSARALPTHALSTRALSRTLRRYSSSRHGANRSGQGKRWYTTPGPANHLGSVVH